VKAQASEKDARPKPQVLIEAMKSKSTASFDKRSKAASRSRRFYLMWAGILAVAVVRPQWILWPLMLAVLAVVSLFLVFGSQRVWRFVSRGLDRLTARSPERGARLLKRLDSIAMKWDKILDRLPEGMVAGLYMPDFQTLKDADERHHAVVEERLSRLQ